MAGADSFREDMTAYHSATAEVGSISELFAPWCAKAGLYAARCVQYCRESQVFEYGLNHLPIVLHKGRMGLVRSKHFFGSRKKAD